MRVAVDEIERDNDIYPRTRMSRKHIESYVEALKAGAIFPPIEIQKIRIKKDDGSNEVKTISLDGMHRLDAYREYNKLAGVEPVKEIEAEFWKDEIIDKEKWLEELRIVSLQLNLKHGLRISEGDIQFQSLRIVDSRPLDSLKGIVSELAEKFGLTQGRLSQLIGERVKKRRASRDSKIYALSLLGWTQQEIGDQFGLSRTAITTIVKNINSNKTDIQRLFHEQNATIDQIFELYNYSPTVLWAIILEGKDDLERFTLFGKSKYGNDRPKDYDVWNFSERDPRLGIRAPGNIPGQIALNVLIRYSKQGDLVVDPMAGGGSTIDACLVMNRKCRAYDINPNEERRDIVQRDVLTGSLPERAMNCDLLFIDPPYYNKVKEIAGFESREAFNRFLEYLSFLGNDSVKTGGHIALILSDYIDYDDPIKSIFTFRAATLFEQHYKTVGHYWCPLSTQQYTASDVVYARDHDRDLQILRECFVFRKTFVFHGSNRDSWLEET